MSWWPTDSTWQYCAQHTRWTEKVDDWYTKRLEKIQKGDAVPLNAGDWTKQIRGSSSLRRITKRVAEAYDHFVEAHVTA